MPRVPTVEAAPSANYGPTGAPIPIGAATIPGQAIARDFAGAIERIGQAEQAIEQARMFADAQKAAGAAQMDLDALSAKYEDDTDFQTIEERFRADASEIFKKHAGTLPAAQSQNLFGTSFQRMARPYLNAVRKDARQRSIEYTKAATIEMGDSLVQRAAEAKDPEIRAVLMDQVTAHWKGAAFNRVVTPEESVKQIKNALSKLDELDARRLVTSDDLKAVQAGIDLLRSGEAFPNMDPMARQRYLEAGLNRADALTREAVRKAEEAERNAEKAKREWQEGNELQLLVAANQGNVSLAQLNELARKRAIRPDAYRAISGLIEKGGSTDGARYFQIRDAINQGQDASQMILQALGERSLSAEDAAKLSDHNRVVQRGEDVYSTQDYRNAEDTLKSAIGDVGPFGNLYENDHKQKFDIAVRELRERIKGAGITMQNSADIWKIADEMLPRYRSKPISAASLPKPRFGVVKTLEDIPVVAAATNQAYQAGIINASDSMVENDLLKRYEDLIKREAAQQELQDKAKDNAGRGKPGDVKSRIDAGTKKKQ